MALLLAYYSPNCLRALRSTSNVFSSDHLYELRPSSNSSYEMQHILPQHRHHQRETYEAISSAPQPPTVEFSTWGSNGNNLPPYMHTLYQYSVPNANNSTSRLIDSTQHRPQAVSSISTSFSSSSTGSQTWHHQKVYGDYRQAGEIEPEVRDALSARIISTALKAELGSSDAFSGTGVGHSSRNSGVDRPVVRERPPVSSIQMNNTEKGIENN